MEKKMPSKMLVKVHIAAKFYDVSKFTIRRWLVEGKLVGEKSPGGWEWRVDMLASSQIMPLPEGRSLDELKPINVSGRRVIDRGVEF